MSEQEERLIPGPKLSPKNNLRLFYIVSMLVFLILIILLVITGYTGYTVSTVHKVAVNTQGLIDDIHELLPTAEIGLDLIRTMCSDKNFTKAYNWTKPWCAKI
jgi:type VI protein secretion system component VasF